MSDRKEFLKKLKDQYDDWNYKWNIERSKLEAKAQHAEAGLRKKYEKQIEELKVKQDDLMAKIKEIQDSSEDAWIDLKDGAEKSWETLKDAFLKAKSNFDKPKDD